MSTICTKGFLMAVLGTAVLCAPAAAWAQQK